MEIFNAINIETIEGEKPSFFVLGSYSTKEKAMEALEKQVEYDMDLYDDLEHFVRTDTPLGFIFSNGYNTYRYEVYMRVLDEQNF